MRHRHLTFALLVAAATATATRAAPPKAAELCALAMKNRPVDQLQTRASCEIAKTQALPRGSTIEQAALLRVPLMTGTVEILMLETRVEGKRAWVDLGWVAGESRSVARGDPLEIAHVGTLESIAVHALADKSVLELVTSTVRTTDDREGVTEVSSHEHIYCRHEGEPICVRIPDRVALTVSGKVDEDLAPYSWKRTVALTKQGEIAIGALEGSGGPSSFDPGAGTHSFASLADRPFVRMFPVIPTVHPDQLEDELELPRLSP
jgi:hypothetical protein